ncbi:MAG: hypothetical protein R2781_05900 [Flavobacteriaceae bacterium]
MKNLLKIIAFSFVMFLGMGSINAQTLKQDQNTPEVIAKQKTEKLSTALNLNGDQQRAVFRALVVKENNYNKDVTGKDSKNATVIANKKKHDEVFETSMKKTLTEAQYNQWKSLQN